MLLQAAQRVGARGALPWLVNDIIIINPMLMLGRHHRLAQHDQRVAVLPRVTERVTGATHTSAASLSEPRIMLQVDAPPSSGPRPGVALRESRRDIKTTRVGDLIEGGAQKLCASLGIL
jgi:hypothetical protein